MKCVWVKKMYYWSCGCGRFSRKKWIWFFSRCKCGKEIEVKDEQ